MKLLACLVFTITSMNIFAADCLNPGTTRTTNCRIGSNWYPMTYQNCQNASGSFGGVVCLSDNDPSNDGGYMSIQACCGLTANVASPVDPNFGHKPKNAGNYHSDQ